MSKEIDNTSDAVSELELKIAEILGFKVEKLEHGTYYEMAYYTDFGKEYDDKTDEVRDIAKLTIAHNRQTIQALIDGLPKKSASKFDNDSIDLAWHVGFNTAIDQVNALLQAAINDIDSKEGE